MHYNLLMIFLQQHILNRYLLMMNSSACGIAVTNETAVSLSLPRLSHFPSVFLSHAVHHSMRSAFHALHRILPVFYFSYQSATVSMQRNEDVMLFLSW